MVLEKTGIRKGMAVAGALAVHALLLGLLAIPAGRRAPGLAVADVVFMSGAGGHPGHPVSASAVSPRKPSPARRPAEDSHGEAVSAPASGELVVSSSAPETQAARDEVLAAGRPEFFEGVAFFPLAAADSLPRFQTRILPVYPRAARRLGKTSQVTLEAWIDAAGVVRQANVAQSGGLAFDQAALTALQRSVFQPARIKDQPIAIKMFIPYQFSLQPLQPE